MILCAATLQVWKSVTDADWLNGQRLHAHTNQNAARSPASGSSLLHEPSPEGTRCTCFPLRISESDHMMQTEQKPFHKLTGLHGRLAQRKDPRSPRPNQREGGANSAPRFPCVEAGRPERCTRHVPGKRECELPQPSCPSLGLQTHAIHSLTHLHACMRLLSAAVASSPWWSCTRKSRLVLSCVAEHAMLISDVKHQCTSPNWIGTTLSDLTSSLSSLA